MADTPDDKKPDLNPKKTDTEPKKSSIGKDVSKVFITGIEATAAAALKAVNPLEQKPISAGIDAAAGIATSKTTSPVKKEAIALAAYAAKTFIDLADTMGEYQKAASQSAFASEDLGKAFDGTDKIFHTYDQGLAQVTKSTGQSIDQVGAGYKELMKSSSFLATGFRDQTDAATRAQKGFDLYSNTVKVARTSGVEFSEASGLLHESLIKQGIGGEEALNSISLLKKGLSETGVTTSQGAKSLGTLTTATEFLTFNSNKTAAAIASVAKAQKDLANQFKDKPLPKDVYKTPMAEMESYTKAVGSATSAQQDFGEALYQAGMQGGGIEEMFDFMDKDPTEALKDMVQNLADTQFGGEILTKDKAKKEGKMSEYMVQTEMYQKQFGMKSPQEAMQFAEAASRGDIKKAAEIKAGTAEKEGALAKEESIKTDDEQYSKMYNQGEVRNKFLGQIAIATGATARSIARSGIEGLNKIFGDSSKIKEQKDAIGQKFGASAADAFGAFQDSKKKGLETQGMAAYKAAIEGSKLSDLQKKALLDLPKAAKSGSAGEIFKGIEDTKEGQEEKKEEGSKTMSPAFSPAETKTTPTAVALQGTQKGTSSSPEKTMSPLSAAAQKEVQPEAPSKQFFEEGTSESGTMLSTKGSTKPKEGFMGVGSNIEGWKKMQPTEATAGKGMLKFDDIKPIDKKGASTSAKSSTLAVAPQAAKPEIPQVVGDQAKSKAAAEVSSATATTTATTATPSPQTTQIIRANITLVLNEKEFATAVKDIKVTMPPAEKQVQG